MEQREMYNEIATLVGSIAKALSLSETETVAGIEAGDIVISLNQDDDGEKFVRIEYEGKKARLYKGAIYYEEVEQES